MNRQEHRALREIEKNLTAEDPALAALLGPSDRRSWRWIYRSTGALAVLLLLLALVLGDLVLMLTSWFVAGGAALVWTVHAFLSDDDRRHR